MRYFIILFLCLLAVSNAQESDTVRAPLPFYVPIIEGQAQNGLVWAWDRYVLQKNYAKISHATIKKNFRDGFTWDDNHWGINFIGHPYQGSYYYNAARSDGYGFYTSYIYSLFGSLTWELFMEQEQPATNDLFTTSYGGTVIGEVLYRMAAHLRSHPNPNWARKIGAVLVSPDASLHWALAEPRGQYPGYVPIEFSVFTGFGYHIVNEYSYNKETESNALEDVWSGRARAWGANLNYGVTGTKVKNPFEQFDVRYHQILDERGTLFGVDIAGTLKNWVFVSDGVNWVDFALKAQYDILYGDFAEMNASAVGLGIKFHQKLSTNWNFELENRLSWLILGTSELYYENALKEQDSTFIGYDRAYQLGTGAKFNLDFDLEWKKRGRFFSESSIYFLRTVPSSVPHYGVEGMDFVAKHFGGVEVYLPWNLRIGYRVDAYWKIAAYEKFSPMTRIMGTNWLYLKYEF